jgi:hypothetical protein
MKNIRFLRSLLFGSSLAAVAIASACGDSKSDDTNTAPSANGNGAAPPSTGTGSLQPNPSGASGSGTSEGNPISVTLDPTRDPSEPVNLIESGAVGCGGGGDFCVAPNSTCCSGPMNAFSCAADASQCPADTVSTAACSSSTSCAAGQVCCRVGGGGGGGGGGNPVTTTCEAACGGGAVQLCLDDAQCGGDNICTNGVCVPAPCTATSCATGEMCCRGMGGGQGAAPACVAPGADGLCPMNRRQVCDDATQCPADNTCAPIGGGGGGGAALVCTPPACTPTSCAAGQVCCVGGGLNQPTCAAASATGACNGNSRLFCASDVECAPSPGTQCLPNPNGGGNGALSCRQPPQPVADAGVDAG